MKNAGLVLLRLNKRRGVFSIPWGDPTTVRMEANRVIPDLLGKLVQQNDGVEAALVPNKRSVGTSD